MKRVLFILGTSVAWVLGLYLVVRAVVEPFLIDLSDPATYRNDWGGPSLFGVLAVHCGPGVLAAAVMIAFLIRRRGAATRENRPRARAHR